MSKEKERNQNIFKRLISFCLNLFSKKTKQKKDRDKNSSDDIYPLW